MADAWPSTLPSTFTTRSYQRMRGDGRLRSQMDAGPAKVRRRSSAMPDTMTGTIIMSTDHLVILRSFVDTTLMGGSLPFLFPDPVDGTPILVRFGDSLPEESDFAIGMWAVNLQLEVLP